jgi:LuxR family maltose regulon positive regulatory protein
MLILDDYHNLEENALRNSSLTFFINNCPENLHLIIVSRKMPSLNLMRKRLAGELGEITQNEVLFSEQEISHYFTQKRLALSPDLIQHIIQLTNGWPALLKLLAVSVEKSGNQQALTELPHEFELLAHSYLSEEVLESVPARVKHFMELTACIEAFNPSLAAWILRSQEVAEPAQLTEDSLRYLSTETIFVAEEKGLGEEPWYRYHPLIKKALRTQTFCKGNDFLQPLYRAVSQWFESEGSLDEAVSYAASARDYDFIRDIILRNWRKMKENDNLSSLLQWFDYLPEEYIIKNPKLCLFEILPLGVTGNFELAYRRYERARDFSKQDGDLYDATADALHSLVKSIEGSTEEAVLSAQRALEKLPQGETHFKAMMYQVLGSSCREDNIVEAQSYFKKAEELQKPLNDKLALCSLYSNLAVLEAQIGAASLSLQHIEQARKASTENEDTFKAMLTFSSFAEGMVFYQRGAQLQAQIACEKMLENSHLNYSSRLVAAAQTILASILERKGFVDQARYLVDQAAQLHFDGFLDVFPGLIFLQDWSKIPIVKNHYASRLLDDTVRISVPEKWCVHALSVLTGQNASRAILDEFEQTIDEQYLLGKLHAHLLIACYEEREGNIEESLAALSQAMERASSEQIIQPFLDAEPFIAQGLKELARRAPESYAARIHKAIPRSKKPNPSRSTLPTLSIRELDVMRLAAAGLSTKEIAERLFIAPETAKKHLNHIFAKLDVHSRTQAIAVLIDMHLL